MDKDEVRFALEHCSTDEIVEFHNRMLDAREYFEEHIYSMDEFDEVFESVSPWEVARDCYYSKRFCPVDRYFYINVYGNVTSFDYYEDADVICLGEIADYLLENEPETIRSFNDES